MTHRDRGSGVRRSERGFTLIEFMVALTLITVVVLGLTAFSATASRSLLRSKKLSLATVAAHQALDSVRATAFNSIEAGSVTTTITGGNHQFYLTTEVEEDGLATPRLKTVTVSVVDLDGRELQRLRSALFGHGGG